VTHHQIRGLTPSVHVYDPSGMMAETTREDVKMQHLDSGTLVALVGSMTYQTYHKRPRAQIDEPVKRDVVFPEAVQRTLFSSRLFCTSNFEV
jgi:hypothetical protein